MIAADTSSIVAYFKGESRFDAEAIEQALKDNRLILPPVVLTELLSDPRLPTTFGKLLLDLPQVELGASYWQEAGHLRAKLLQKGFKARLGDALIAQACLQEDLTLITHDHDFRHYEKYFKLKILKPQ